MFKWTDRKRYIQKTVDWLIDKFEHNKDFEFDVDIDLVVDLYLDRFSKNPEWIGHRSFNNAKKTILNSAYSQAKRLGLSKCMIWVEKNL